MEYATRSALLRAKSMIIGLTNFYCYDSGQNTNRLFLLLMILPAQPMTLEDVEQLTCVSRRLSPDLLMSPWLFNDSHRIDCMNSRSTINLIFANFLGIKAQQRACRNIRVPFDRIQVMLLHLLRHQIELALPEMIHLMGD